MGLCGSKDDLPDNLDICRGVRHCRMLLHTSSDSHRYHEVDLRADALKNMQKHAYSWQFCTYSEQKCDIMNT